MISNVAIRNKEQDNQGKRKLRVIITLIHYLKDKLYLLKENKMNKAELNKQQ